MTTARQIIEQAARKLNILGRGQTLPAEEASAILDELNDLLGSWSVEGGLVYQDVQETFNLSSTQNQYTIGTGGDFNTERPYVITTAFVTQVGSNTDYPLEIYNIRQYAEIQQKDTQGIPEAFYYDNNFPLGNVFLYPQPSANYTLTLYSRKPLTSFTTLNTNIDLPPGYKRALVNNLAVEIAAQYEKEPTQMLIKNAQEGKGNVFAANSRNDDNVTSIDQFLSSGDRFDIYGGDF